jgi:hypothetical protein
MRTAAAAAAGAIVVAIAALSVHAGPSAAVTTSTDPAPHTITVSANGKVTIVPDVARVTLGVTYTRPSVKAARADAAATMTKIIGAVKKLGIADADIRTVGINLYPQYNNSAPPRVTGYSISEQLEITIRDLDKAGDVVDATTAQGATDVNGISFELADPDKAMNDARAAAVSAAQASAQAMASAGHVSLGPVVSISDASPVSPIVYGKAMLSAADGAVATPVQPGTQDVSVTLTVVFAIS